MRRYDDPVEVRRGICGSADLRDVGTGEGPEQFLWRGRLWKVRAVLAHWVETGPWWTSPGGSGSEGGGGVPGDLLAEREMWRVEAGRGAGEADRSGVFDLSFSWTDGSWQLVGCSD